MVIGHVEAAVGWQPGANYAVADSKYQRTASAGLFHQRNHALDDHLRRSRGGGSLHKEWPVSLSYLGRPRTWDWMALGDDDRFGLSGDLEVQQQRGTATFSLQH